jgi:hypothetical protein
MAVAIVGIVGKQGDVGGHHDFAVLEHDGLDDGIEAFPRICGYRSRHFHGS